MLMPREPKQDLAIIIEFKVRKPKQEASLEDTVFAAHRQIEEKNYDAALLARGIAPERIRHYGFAFQGKQVLIGSKGLSEAVRLNCYPAVGYRQKDEKCSCAFKYFSL